MKLRTLAALSTLALVLPLFAADSEPMPGFLGNHAAAQRQLESKFDSSLDAKDLDAWMKRLSAKPHHAGSPYGKEDADFIASLFRSWGYDTAIEEFQVLFPTPKERLVEVVSPERFTAKLDEPPVRDDASSLVREDMLPPYNAYSADGDVTADVVYVNYGIPADYEKLAEMGIDVKGKIVVARYGGSWRGIKPKVAAEHGALGCIIYSDPRDDGYFEGDVYPKGSWRNENGVQRGSVEDMPLYPGDPLTPGVGATPDAKRLALKDTPVLTKIPVLPISYSDALGILRQMDGPVAPESWRGALPITYHVGPGPAKVHLKVASNWNTVTIHDVIAKMRGAERPDEWVVRGNHHDGWVFGAADPLSGQVAMLEEAKAIGALAKNGWKPKRTIIYAAWDAEEPGLIGSTEWVETHASELAKHAVAYINSDSNDRGFLYVGGSHTLEHFINDVARDVTDPEKQISVFERARDRRLVGASEADKKLLHSQPDLAISALGSGSDYTPFLQHLGIAALNIGYGGESDGGDYHSIYDSYEHYKRFGDPTFEYGLTLAKTGGRAVLRLANADVVPFGFSNFADTVQRYANEVSKLADRMREETIEQNKLIEDGTLAAVSDPTKTYVAPAPKDPVPYLNFAPLQNAVVRLRDAADAYQKRAAKFDAQANVPPAALLEKLDQVLYTSERTLTRPEGLEGRPWFRHQIYAPGFYTGYGVKTLPAIRESIEQREWKKAAAGIDTVAETLDAFTAEIRKATEMMK
ncbi:MAG: M28 family metallopeptidase [Thermoanaerobaculia bacterium]